MRDEVVYEIADNSANACLCVREDKTDGTFRVVYSNKALRYMLGDGAIDNDTIWERALSDNLLDEDMIANFHKILSTGQPYSTELYIHRLKKKYFCKMYLIVKEYISIVFFDITEYENDRKTREALYNEMARSQELLKYQLDLQKATKRALEKREHLYKIITEESSDSFHYINYVDDVKAASDKWYEMFNIKKGSKYEFEDVKYAISSNDSKAFTTSIRNEVQDNIVRDEYIYRLADNSTWIKDTRVVMNAEDGKPIEQINFYKDITVEQEQRLSLEKMAYFDSQTNMHNRNYFLRYIENQMKDEEAEFAILYIDIDDLKKINDSMGILVGDEIIQKVADIIKEFEHEGVVCARFLGDEFVVYVPGWMSEEYALKYYYDIASRVGGPLLLTSGIEILITISAGVVKYPDMSQNAVELVRDADVAVSYAKENGKSRVEVFKKNMLDDFLDRIFIERKLKVAIDNSALYLNYQPQFESETNRLRGVEALIRWKDNELGLVNPGKFIPVAEETGCIVSIGTWVMKEAVKVLASWQKKYDYRGIMSVNISTLQLKETGFMNGIRAIIDDYDVRAEQLEIEITESVFIDDVDIIMPKLREMREIGIKISLDDFGTGYSSLSYLKDMPIDTLKIDKTFVDTMLKDPSTNIITSSLISMVRQLGLETIAEGVETEEQLEYLKKMNCDNIQGFLLSKPVKAEEIEEIIIKQKNRQ